MGETFHGVIAFAFLVALILFGAVLRVNLRFLQTSLVPASLLGGVIGFILINTDLAFGFKSEDFVAFAFHFFTLSFMSLVLTGKEQSSADSSIQPGGLWLSFGWVSSLVLQALVGLTVIVVFNAVSGGELSLYLGMIVTHGFTQGPGQALAMGNLWEGQFGISDAVNFGLIYASMGFIVSFIVGVPAARFAIWRGLNQNTSARLTEEFLKGVHARSSRPIAGYQVTHSGNVDSLVFHLGVLGVAYLLTHQYLLAVQDALHGVTVGPIPIELLFSHNLFFIHGLIVCLILRGLMNRSGVGHYIDNETQKRITGSSVDLMMAATVMSIQFALLAEHLIPIVAVCIAVAITTGALCFGFGRLLNTFPAERAVTLFGCCTGSTGSGLLLLRILDPDLSTPVARELAYFNVAIIFLGMHILSIMAPVLPTFSMGTVIAVYVGTFVVGAFALALFSKRV